MAVYKDALLCLLQEAEWFLHYSPVRSAVYNEPAQRILCAIDGACTVGSGFWSRLQMVLCGRDSVLSGESGIKV